MSESKNEYMREYRRNNPDKTKKYQKKYYNRPEKKLHRKIEAKKWRMENTEEAKELTRKNQIEYRKSKKGKEYNRLYQIEYYKDELHRKCQNIRCHFAQPTEKRKTIMKIPGLLEYVIKIKAEAKNKYPNEKIAINHIISIPHFFKFNINIAKEIINDPINLEAIPMPTNSRKSNHIGDEQFELARKLLEKYPRELRGFLTFLEKKKIEIDTCRVGTPRWKRKQKEEIKQLEKGQK
jgi:hypothetical protein